MTRHVDQLKFKPRYLTDQPTEHTLSPTLLASIVITDTMAGEDTAPSRTPSEF
jgi:hypothetical protein